MYYLLFFVPTEPGFIDNADPSLDDPELEQSTMPQLVEDHMIEMEANVQVSFSNSHKKNFASRQFIKERQTSVIFTDDLSRTSHSRDLLPKGII